MAYDPLIEAWINADLDGLRTVQIQEGVGGWYVFTLDQHYVFQDALDYWETAINAEPALSGDYTFAYAEATGLVTISRSGGNFEVRLSDSLYTALGHPAEEQTGASSYATTGTCTLAWNVAALDYSAPRPVEEVDLLEFRHGRVYAQHHHHSRMSVVRIVDSTTAMRSMVASPILGGRVRVYTSTDRAAAYSATNLDGYLQGYCAGLSQIRTFGASDQLAEVELALSVEAA